MPLCCVLTQDRGKISQDYITVSYFQCLPGTFSNKQTLCFNCSTGMFNENVGAFYCIECPAVSHSQLYNKSSSGS